MSNNNDDDFKYLRGKVDVIHDALTNQSITLVRLTDSVEYHVKRTDILEDEVKRAHSDILPIKKHVERLQGAAWVIGGALSLAALAHQFGLL